MAAIGEGMQLTLSTEQLVQARAQEATTVLAARLQGLLLGVANSAVDAVTIEWSVS